MKVMSLNIWGGRIREPLLEFVKQQSEVDVFCLQEVYRNAQAQVSTEEEPVYALDIFSELQRQLTDHHGFFRPVVGDAYGIGMFVGRNLDVLDEGAITIYDNPCYPGRGPTHSRKLQWIKVRDRKSQSYAILNVHGLWNGRGKKDSPERIAQSRKIREFIDTIDLPTILCGDFNLLPDTASVGLLEDVLENLIRKYNISSTRTTFYPKSEKFADYIFTSADLKIKDFQVLREEVSDHAPLVLEFV